MKSIEQKYTNSVRRRQTRTLAALLALALASCTRQSGGPPPAENTPVLPAPSGPTEGGQIGFFLNVSGTVTASGAGQSSEPVRIGDPIFAPETIETAPLAACRIQLGTNALVDLEDSTRIELPSESPPAPKSASSGPVEARSGEGAQLVLVDKGTALFSVGRVAAGDALAVATRGARARTSGADFLVNVAGDRTTLAVGRGAARAKPAAAGASGPSAEETLIRGGFQLTIGAGAGAPVPLASEYRDLLFRGSPSDSGAPAAEPSPGAPSGASQGPGGLAPPPGDPSSPGGASAKPRARPAETARVKAGSAGAAPESGAGAPIGPAPTPETPTDAVTEVQAAEPSLRVGGDFLGPSPPAPPVPPTVPVAGPAPSADR